MPGYESVIGLEVHAQLKTRTKLFCGCAAEFGASPNTRTCPVCLGHPGTLPVLNAEAVALAVRGALALGCEISRSSVFARKNYFYPDLPKGYQISQYEEPLATGGRVEIESEVDGADREIELIRLHLEEDAGKSIHDGMSDSDRFSHVDLNRSGVPLAEIVTEPEIRSPEEAYRFLERLRSILRYTGVCDGNMEEGSLRCDANVSIRHAGTTALGTRTELKNLNSFRNVRRALEYEIERQEEILRSGEGVLQETVLWDAAAGATRPMRGKEQAHDYRYFPEPDLPPLEIEGARVRELRDGLPELPAVRKRRLAAEHGLSPEQSHRLTLDPLLADYFEAVVRHSGRPKAAANFILNDLLREKSLAQLAGSEVPVPAEHLAELIRLVEEGKVSVSVARRELFPEMLRTGVAPAARMRERGLQQVSDEQTLRDLVREVVAAHPQQLEQYRAGKTGLFAWFVGQVMRRSEGRANPQRVNELLRDEIG